MPGSSPAGRTRLCVSGVRDSVHFQLSGGESLRAAALKRLAALADRRKIGIFQIERSHSGFFWIWYVRCCT